MLWGYGLKERAVDYQEDATQGCIRTRGRRSRGWFAASKLLISIQIRILRRMELHDDRHFSTIVLTPLFFLALVRLVGYAVDFARVSLQMDFAAFYAAGQAMAHGYSPYVNNVVHDPNLWDGWDPMAHSLFIYPPIVAHFFLRLTILGYGPAKLLWTLANLGWLGIATVLSLRLSGVRLRSIWLLVVGLFVCLFHPVMILLERGQIDAITLTLALLAIWLLMRGRRGQMLAGFSFALLTLLKLHGCFVIPFVVIRKKWVVLIGYFIASCIILFASIVVDGVQANADYVVNQLPRISKYGHLGPQELMIDGRLLDGINKYAKDGIQYRWQYWDVGGEASLARLLRTTFEKNGIQFNQTLFSAVLLAVFFTIVELWQRKHPFAIDRMGSRGELAYWSGILAIVLLAGPMTWPMNVVWLLPAGVVILTECAKLTGRKQAVWLGVGLLGLAIAAWTDGPLTFPFVGTGNRYILAEMLVCVSLFGLLDIGLSEPS